MDLVKNDNFESVLKQNDRRPTTLNLNEGHHRSSSNPLRPIKKADREEKKELVSNGSKPLGNKASDLGFNELKSTPASGSVLDEERNTESLGR